MRHQIHHLLCANDVRRHPDRSRYYVQVPGMFDLDMTDAHLLSPLVPWPGLAGPIGAERAHHIINAYSVAFFDKELRGQRVPLLDGPSERFPEVVFEHRP